MRVEREDRIASIAGTAVDRTVRWANRTDIPAQRLRIALAERTLNIACNIAGRRNDKFPSGAEGIPFRLAWSDFNPLSCEAGEQIEALQALQRGEPTYYHLAGGNRYRRPIDRNGVRGLR